MSTVRLSRVARRALAARHALAALAAVLGVPLALWLAPAPALAQDMAPRDLVPEPGSERGVIAADPSMGGLSADARARRERLLEARTERLDELFDELSRTRSPSAARLIEGRIWSEWMQSGSRTIDFLMGAAARAAQGGNHALAFDHLDHIIVLVPDYAEAWNRRATLHFMVGSYDASVRDIEETLSREPRHFGALSGLGQIMLRLDRPSDAREAFQRTLDVYPANRNAQNALAEIEETLSGEPL